MSAYESFYLDKLSLPVAPSITDDEIKRAVNEFIVSALRLFAPSDASA